MWTTLRVVIAAALLAPLAASATTVVLRDPGYLQIDGIYYGFDLPRQNGTRVPVELHPRHGDGFYLRSLASLSQCEGDISPSAGATPAALRHAEVLDQLDAPQLGLKVDGSNARFLLARCDGAVVLITRSASGHSRCAGSVGFPFRRGQCTAIDANDPGLVFFSAFERQ